LTQKPKIDKKSAALGETMKNVKITQKPISAANTYTYLFMGILCVATLLAAHPVAAIGPKRSTVYLHNFRFEQPAPQNTAAEVAESIEPEPMPRFSTHYTLTSYTSIEALTDSTPFITASGSHVRLGTVAANCLPFGTQIKIPDLFGDYLFTVEDRLNARKGCGMIDVWLPTYAEAKQFGVKFKVVEVF